MTTHALRGPGPASSRRRRGAGIALAALLAAACGPDAGALALHVLDARTPAGMSPSGVDDYYALPFPNDLRLEADGSIDLEGYPRLGGALDRYVDACDRGCLGFGPNAGVFFRFGAPLDGATLPADAAASLEPEATAFLVDVTPSSPGYGRRAPVSARYVAEAYAFIGASWVALLPLPGFPLRERTTYAAILTDGLRSEEGQSVRRAPALDAVLQADPQADPRAASAYAPLSAWLETQPGLTARIVNATVFTTADATAMMRRLRTTTYQTPAPTLRDLAFQGPDQAGVNEIYVGSYDSPNFQEGDPPYGNEGGLIRVAPDGTPQPVRTERLRVAISLPEGDMPTGGWPVVLYAHGTGGDYQSFVYDGSAAGAAKVLDATGAELGRLAMISIDQVLHGPRDPTNSDPQLGFFNVQNIEAARDNVRQGAADDFQLLRLVKAIDVAAAPSTGRPIRFDPQRIYFKGHSQGGLTGPLFLGAEPEIKAAVLSGAGGGLILSLLTKTEPVDIPGLIGAILPDPVDAYHPLLSLVQTFLEGADPLNHARLFFREPAEGMAPKNIFQSLGVGDHYTPNPVTEALALAMGVQPVEPRLKEIDGLELSDLTWTTAPVRGNVAGGQATGVLLQYQPPGKSDGHFVIFNVPVAGRQSNAFLATHAATGIAGLDP